MYLRGSGGFLKLSKPYSYSKYPKDQTASKIHPATTGVLKPFHSFLIFLSQDILKHTLHLTGICKIDVERQLYTLLPRSTKYSYV